MAKKIIILGTYLQPDGSRRVDAVFWFPVNVGDEVPLAGAQSAYSGAIAAETTALQNGTVVEQPFSDVFPANATKAAIEASFQTSYATALATWQQRNKPKTFFGTYWDGSVWT